MTDESRGIGGVAGPPWSVDTLADLHAGVLDQQTANQLWSRVEHDPEARAILNALDATTDDLSELGTAPAEPIPAEVAAKLDAALADEANQHGSPGQTTEAPVAPVTDMAAARQRRRRRLQWGAGVVGVAAAAVAAVAIAVPSNTTTPGTPNVAEPGPAQGTNEQPLSLRSDDMGNAVGPAMGARDFGPLGTQGRLNQCLQANGIDPATKPAGVRGATVDGQPATVVVLTTGQLAQYRMLALAPTCGPDNPGTVFDKVVGRQGG